MRRHRVAAKGHREIRGMLRLIGPLMAVTGLILTVMGISSVFSSVGSLGASGFPDRLWMVFVGTPLLAVGVGITRFAFMGAVGRYMAGEVAPVAKDTINYMAEGTRESVKDLAGAVGEGLGLRGGGVVVRCHKCNVDNDADSKFCKQCGTALEKNRPCPSCQELNDPDARFCDNCGHRF